MSNSNGWSGDHVDYGTSDHLKECGAKFTESISESGSINSYDTFSGRTNFGLEANVTCNCNKLVQRKTFLANESMSSLIRYFDEDSSSEISPRETNNWWRDKAE